MDNKQAFLEFRKALIDAIVSNSDFQRAKASGKTESYLKSESSYEVDQTYFRQFTTAYSANIDSGTPPGGDFRTTFTGIYEWLKFKKYGLSWASPAQRISLASVITRKIVESGSFKYRNPDQQTTIFQDSIKKALPVLLQRLGASVLQAMQSEVGKEVNAIRKDSRK